MPIAYVKYKVIHDLKNASVYIVCARVCAKLLQSCKTLCDTVDCSPPGSSVMGFSKPEYWSGLPCPSPGDLPDPGIKLLSLASLALASGFFTIALPKKEI